MAHVQAFQFPATEAAASPVSHAEWRERARDKLAARPPCARGDGRSYSFAAASRICVARYSWLPATGLNLIPRNATPIGTAVDASMVMAVQMMFVEVAAIAVVP